MNLVKISENNIEDLFSLMKGQSGWMRTDELKKYEKNNYIGENKTLYGMYDDQGHLVSSMGAIYYEKINFFYLYNMVTKKNEFTYFNLVDNGLSVIWEKILTESLMKEYYSFFWVHSAKGWPMKKFKSLYYNSIPSFHKYYRSIMCYIPANTLPSFTLYKSWLGNKTWDIDTVIEQAVLKPEFHPSGYQMYNL